ncbi:MAG: hypothetical protein Q4A15_00305 [Prevotellaceae bacterium]|nr:hypothetical protein [Prevotellaceae bacterium]
MKELQRLLSPKILAALGTVLLLSLLFWQLGCPDVYTRKAVQELRENPALSYEQSDLADQQAAERQMQYIAGYHDAIQQILEQAEQMSAFSIFSKADGFATQNLQRTASDYAPLSELPVQIGIDEPITTLLSPILRAAALLGSIILTLNLLAERKKGLWPVIYTSAKGRMHFATRRCAILAVVSLLYHIITYGVALLVGLLRYGGWNDLNRYVQSIEMFAQVTTPLHIWQFVLWYVVLCWLGALLVCLVFGLTLALLRQPAAAVMTTAALFAIGWAIENWLSFAGGALHYFNLFSATCAAEHATVYQNISFGQGIISVKSLRIILLLLCVLLFTIACIFTGRQRPIGGPLRTPRIISFLQSWYQHLLQYLHLLGMELYQIFVVRHGVLLLLVVGLGLYRWLDLSPASYTAQDYMCQVFYEEYGQDRKSADAYITDTQTMLQQEDRRWQKAADQYASGTISADEYEAAKQRYQALDTTRYMMDTLLEQQAYLKTQNDTQLPYVDSRGYQELMMPFYQNSFCIGNLILIVLLCAPVFREEKGTIRRVLFALPRGRSTLVWRKLMSCMICVSVIWAIFGAFEIASIQHIFGLTQLSAPAQTIPLFASVRLPLWLWLVLLYCKRLLGMFGLAMLVVLLGYLLPTTVSVIVALLAYILPELIAYLYVPAFGKLSVLRILALDSSWIPSIMLVLLGILAAWGCLKQWNRNEVS